MSQETFENFEGDASQQTTSKKIEEIVLRSAKTSEIQQAIGQAPDKMEAIRSVRKILRDKFPEIADLPEPRPKPDQRPIGLLPSNEFIIAKRIVEFLSNQ